VLVNMQGHGHAGGCGLPGAIGTAMKTAANLDVLVDFDTTTRIGERLGRRSCHQRR
jgi:hypothetical protein